MMSGAAHLSSPSPSYAMSPTDGDFAQVAKRYLAAAQHGGPAHEVLGFDAYHAVESMASAWVAHCGQVLPSRHDAKLVRFGRLTKGAPFSRQAAGIVLAFNAVRNRFLYPIDVKGGRSSLPMDFMRAKDVLRLVKTAAYFIRLIDPHL
jgi:hypothetical protein